MPKLSKTVKNVLVFIAIFLALNYALESCQKEEEIATNSGNLYFATTETEYSRRQAVTLKVINNTKKDVIIENECPNEPFTVLHYENNEWVPVKASPKLECQGTKDLTLKPTEKINISYSNWNNALFSQLGRFKIEFTTNLNGAEKTVHSNEFTIVKEGVIKQLWTGVFYRPIYNGLIALISVMPGHDLGLAIILLTILIRTILLVPSHKAMRAQKKMADIQPQIEKIKEKHKGDQQKIAMETMAIWKEAQISPLSSCLPILLQFPFLIALFYVINGGLNPDNGYLLYTQYPNFSFENINVHFLGLLDLTKINLYVLPLVVGGLQFIQMKLATAKTPATNKKDGKSNDIANQFAQANKMMIYLMPVMIAVFTASLPAGVGLYWGTSTLYGIVQQLFINKEKPGKKSKDEPTVRVISN